MCNSFYSSWREKIEKKLKYDKKIIHSLYSWVWKIDDFHEVIPDVNEIYISGWEPFMHKELRGLVHYLHDNDFAKNILFRVNTNMTIVDHELFKLFEKFQWLRFLVSCDGYKDSYNKIRLGWSWDIFKNNFLEFLKYKNQFENMGITVNIVVQIDNISHITNLYYFFESLGINNVNLLLLTLPSHFDIRILPETFRKKRLDEIRKFVKGNFSRKEKFKDIIVALEGGMENTHLLSKYSLENETFDKYIIS
jgi:sulfatase maturation enzyme AslB (radical SAM superfamily)